MAGDPRTRRRRLAWACRRGMLELDLLLAPLAAGIKSVPEPDLDLVEELLAMSDTQLWDILVAGRRQPRPELAHVLTRVRAGGTSPVTA